MNFIAYGVDKDTERIDYDEYKKISVKKLDLN